MKSVNRVIETDSPGLAEKALCDVLKPYGLGVTLESRSDWPKQYYVRVSRLPRRRAKKKRLVAKRAA